MGLAAAGYSVVWAAVPVGGLLAAAAQAEMPGGKKHIVLMGKLLLGAAIVITLNAVGLWWPLRLAVYILFIIAAAGNLPVEGSLALITASAFLAANTGMLWLVLGLGFLAGIAAGSAHFADNNNIAQLILKTWYFLPIGFILIGARNLFI